MPKKPRPQSRLKVLSSFFRRFRSSGTRGQSLPEVAVASLLALAVLAAVMQIMQQSTQLSISTMQTGQAMSQLTAVALKYQTLDQQNCPKLIQGTISSLPMPPPEAPSPEGSAPPSSTPPPTPAPSPGITPSGVTLYQDTDQTTVLFNAEGTKIGGVTYTVLLTPSNTGCFSNSSVVCTGTLSLRVVRTTGLPQDQIIGPLNFTVDTTTGSSSSRPLKQCSFQPLPPGASLPPSIPPSPSPSPSACPTASPCPTCPSPAPSPNPKGFCYYCDSIYASNPSLLGFSAYTLPDAGLPGSPLLNTPAGLSASPGPWPCVVRSGSPTGPWTYYNGNVVECDMRIPFGSPGQCPTVCGSVKAH